jgi:hypothetical protein
MYKSYFMKKIYTYIITIVWLVALTGLLPFTSEAQNTCPTTCGYTWSVGGTTDWTTNCNLISTNPDNNCDPTSDPADCKTTPDTKWTIINNPNNCVPKPPCNAVGFKDFCLSIQMGGTYNVTNLNTTSSATGLVQLAGCTKAYFKGADVNAAIPTPPICQVAPNRLVGFNLAGGANRSGTFAPTFSNCNYTPTPADFMAACAGTLCFEGIGDGLVLINQSNGNVSVVTTVTSTIDACISYNTYTASVTGTEAACETSADGKIFVNFTPATGTILSDYEIRWSSNGTTWAGTQAAVSGANTISNLAPGSYTVAVVYKPLANSVLPNNAETCGFCKYSTSVGSATATLTCGTPNPDCPDDGGVGDGAVSVNLTGTSNLGTPTYSWIKQGNVTVLGTAATLTGLTAGNYIVTVTYGPNNKCSKTQTCTVVDATGVTFTATPTNVTCFGVPNGKLDVTPTGGTGPFSINVTGPSSYNQTQSNVAQGTAKDFTGLKPGNYTITVTDANGCSATDTKQITEPTAITCGNFLITNAPCEGKNTGAVQVSASGGTPFGGGQYKFTLKQGANTIGGPTQGANPTFSNLAAGSYTVVIEDANGCTKECPVTIGVDKTLVCPDISTASVCENGIATFTITNNPSAYTGYSWQVLNGGTAVGSTTGTTLQVQASGTDKITVELTASDAAGCSKKCPEEVDIIPNPTATATGADVCLGTTSTTLTLSGLDANEADKYSINFAGGLISNVAITNITGNQITVTLPNNLPADTYTGTITLTNSSTTCSGTAPFSFKVNPLPDATVTIDEVCINPGGSVFVTYRITNLVGATAYSIGGNAGNIPNDGLVTIISASPPSSGTFQAPSITLINPTTGCTKTINLTIKFNPLPSCDITTTNATTCAGTTGLAFSGPAGLAMNAQTGVSTYTWSFVGNANGATFSSATNIQNVTVTAGTGNFTVQLVTTNSFGCSKTCTQLVTVNPLPPCDITGPPQVCAETSATFTAPAGNYDYAWSITNGNASAAIQAGTNDDQTVTINATSTTGIVNHYQ